MRTQNDMRPQGEKDLLRTNRIKTAQKPPVRKGKKRPRLNMRMIAFALLIVIIMSIAVISLSRMADNLRMQRDALGALSQTDENGGLLSAIAEPKIEYPEMSMYAKQIGGDIASEYGVLVDCETNLIIAEKNSEAQIYPASMTKVMTLIVAYENIRNLDDTFTFSYEFLNDLYLAGASCAGFMSSETVPVRDLLYGAVLPSGADACEAIAIYVAGGEEEFAELMNKKVETMGLKNTHFSNSSGLHAPDHYSTVTDMAVILKYALDSAGCREILSTYTYTTSKTEQHPEGIELYSTMFTRMRGDEPETAQVIAGKTGYTIEGKNCLASMARTPDGHEYIFVSAFAPEKYDPVFDCITVYKNYLPHTEDTFSESLSGRYEAD